MGVQESNLAGLSSAELDLGLDELTMLIWRLIHKSGICSGEVREDFVMHLGLRAPNT